MSGPRVVDVINLSSSAWTLLRRRVLAMRAAGIDNRILCMDGPYVARLRAEGIPVHVVPLPRGLDPLRLVVSFLAVWLYLRRQRIELVHTHCSIPGVVGRLAARCAGVPVIVHTVHGFHFHDRSRGPAAAAFVAVERACARVTRLLLTQNRADLARAERLRIGRADRRLYVGNGIDLGRFRPGAAGPGTNGTARLTCVARLEPVKNHADLLASAAVLKSRGMDFRLRLVGDGPLRERLVRRCRDLGIEREVEFLGYREDVPALLADTDIAVLASHKEGMPRAVLEAMAMGLPVVGTRVTGTREAVEHGRTGFLVAPDDVDAFAAAIELLIESPALRESMGREARRAALQHYDEEAITEKLRRVYRTLLDEAAERASRSARAGAPGAGAMGATLAAPDAELPGRALAVVGGPTVGRNAALRLGALVLGAVVNLAGLILLGNALGASGYGEYAWYYALIPLVASLADAGVGIVVMREIARDVAAGPRWIGDGIVARAAIGGVLLAAGTAAAFATGFPAPVLPLAIVLLTALVDPSQDVALWWLRARERLDGEALLLLLSQGVWIGLLVAGVALHAGVPWMLAAALLAFSVRQLAGAALAGRILGRPRFAPDPARLRRLIGQGLPFGLAMLGAVLYGRVGLLLLRALSTHAAVAHFQVAYLLTQPFGLVASAVSVASFPMLSRRSDGEPGAFARALREAVRWELLLALPLIAGLVVLAPALVARLFPSGDFAESAGAIRVMAPALGVILLNLTARYALPALGRQRLYLAATLAGLAMNLGLGVLLVPRWGVMGAVAAYLSAELTILVCCRRALAAHWRGRDLVADAWRPLLAALAAGLVMAMLSDLPVELAAAAGALTYAAGAWSLGAFGPLGRRTIVRGRAAVVAWERARSTRGPVT